MSSTPETIDLPSAGGFPARPRSVRFWSASGLMGGSLIMLGGTILVSLLNFSYNIAVARMLGAAAFSQAAVAVTLLMLFSAITLAFQLVCAKFVARNETAAGQAFVYRGLLRRAWAISLGLATTLCILSRWIATFLQLSSPWLIVVLALGIAFYIPIGVKRGGLQGVRQFQKLSSNYVLETFVKFSVAILLVGMGLGVMGAVVAIAVSELAAYLWPKQPAELHAAPQLGEPASFREGMQMIVFFIGQVIITNIDIVLVKHFFKADIAGLYAAIALVGRLLYFASWSVVSAMFPIAAGNAKVSGAKTDENRAIVLLPLSFVAVMCIAFITFLGLFPGAVLHVLFGAGFREIGRGMEGLLMMHAAATGAYAMAVVLMTFEMSRRIANTSWVQLGASGLVVLGIILFHRTLQEVIIVQRVLMFLLLIAVAVPFVRSRNRRTQLQEAAS